MNKEEMKVEDLLHLQERALTIVESFRKANSVDRSNEYRAFHLKNAERIANTLLRDFDYYLDTFKIGGIEPYDLSRDLTK